MKFEKPHRREPSEPQLAAMIDVFSILIIFLIAGTAMDSSVLEIPGDLFLAETTSKSNSVNAPQVTLKDGLVTIKFIDEKIGIDEIELDKLNSPNVIRLGQKLKNYLNQVGVGNKKNPTDKQLLQSINLVADKDTPYKHVYSTIKFFRIHGFQNSILVGTENNGKNN